MRKFMITLEGLEHIYDVIEGEFMEVACQGESASWRAMDKIDPEYDFILSDEIRFVMVRNHTRRSDVGCFPTVEDFMIFAQYYMKARVVEIALSDPAWWCQPNCAECHRSVPT